MGAIQSVGDVRQRVECGRRGAASSSPRPIRLRADTNFKWPRLHSCATTVFMFNFNENKSDIICSYLTHLHLWVNVSLPSSFFPIFFQAILKLQKLIALYYKMKVNVRVKQMPQIKHRDQNVIIFYFVNVNSLCFNRFRAGISQYSVQSEFIQQYKAKRAYQLSKNACGGRPSAACWERGAAAYTGVDSQWMNAPTRFLSQHSLVNAGICSQTSVICLYSCQSLKQTRF